ncbi:MAG: N-acetylglucosamine-6-phosphate deacetylase [Lachnospiraceae bacterium]|nr:N-acetylglucosamine-6-phosphate deacetylase [Lachnospiraceae bacterium]
MYIKNVKYYGKDQKFHEGGIGISGGTFAEHVTEEKPEGMVYDGKGCYALPGLIDLHFHGALGQDVCDGTMEAVETIARYEAAEGVTAICPATLTLGVSELNSILANMAAFRNRQAEGEFGDCADLIGINMEGPFISEAKKGAQNPAYIIPCDAGIVDGFLSASEGLLKIIGLAPEENPNFESYIEAVKGSVTVSLAHTNSDYDTALRAFKAGAKHAVHLYNAMPEMIHREPGVVGAVSDMPHVNAEIIADGIHVHPAAVRATFKMNGPERMILISDSLRSTGMPDGRYELGGQAITKQGKYCRLVEGGALAGSVSNLRECMVNAVKEMDIPLETAVACATIHPARALGIDDLYGSIEEGKKADVVLLNEDLTFAGVIKDGKLLGGKP